ncbi:Vacuolar protein sorting-associated protein ist1 [Coemansia helicoidea]|uniref:Vacuolar protein sorting-associated protein ist1 n=1 Tax=Coemansia helicoidea TaxID=1286919 RepID=A0ACC1L772_9FUNG|nr:Vacuolar protein sorting-associated protein ist1 [Coemansia helicoidea]
MPAKFPLSKFKVELKLAANRLRFLQEKQTALNTKARRGIASLLEAGKVASATVRVEGIIRDDLHIEAMEIVELFCELLCARAGLVDQLPTVDPGLCEAVSSVIYASSRIEARELPRIRDLLAAKYGKDVVMGAADNADGHVNAKLLQKLSVTPPSQALVGLYLKEIAAAYRVDWRPDGDSDDDKPSGGLREPAGAVPAEPMLPVQAPEQEDGDGADGPRADEGGDDVAALLSIPAPPTDRSTGDAEAADTPPAAPVEVPAIQPARTPADKSAPDKDAESASSGTPTMDELQRRFDALRQL